VLAFILFLVIVAIVLGIVGVVVKGLLYLLFIGIVVFLVGLLTGAVGNPATEPPRPVIRHQALIPPDTVQHRSSATWAQG
jgi:hypothetical protein